MEWTTKQSANLRTVKGCTCVKFKSLQNVFRRGSFEPLHPFLSYNFKRARKSFYSSVIINACLRIGAISARPVRESAQLYENYSGSTVSRIIDYFQNHTRKFRRIYQVASRLQFRCESTGMGWYVTGRSMSKAKTFSCLSSEKYIKCPKIPCNCTRNNWSE